MIKKLAGRINLPATIEIPGNNIRNFIEKHTKFSIIAVYNIINIIAIIIFYPLFPVLLNFPPDLIKEKELMLKTAGSTYEVQYGIIAFLIVLIGSAFLMKVLKGIDKWRLLNLRDNGNIDEIYRLRKKCMNVPYAIYTAQILFPSIFIFLLGGFMVFITKGQVEFINVIKIDILVFSYMSLAGVISLIFSKKIFKNVLIRTYRGDSPEGVRIGLKRKIFLQILPMFIVAVLITSLLGYSGLVTEKGGLLFRIYKDKLVDSFKGVDKAKDMNQIREILKQVRIENSDIKSFVVAPDGKTVTSDGSTLDFMFISYMNDLSEAHDGRVYNFTGETQGAVIKIKGDGGYWTAGVQYRVVSNEAMISFLIGFIVILLLNAVILLLFSKALAGDISLVAENFSEIAEGSEVSLEKTIAVTSNDVIGDLVVAFNKIQERVKENIRSIREAQDMLMERERLASLGQLIGGIAHNINTPIMSISGGLEALQDLAVEYQESIYDESVTKEDHNEIAGEILAWIRKMKPYCSYMSDIIAAVKGQAVQLSDSSTDSYTLGELVKRVEILMDPELKKHHCRINVDLGVNINTRLKGEINSLVQVFNNLITNAAESYESEGGVVHLRITRKNSSIEFAVKDYGKGIPEQVQHKLFKEMITTKGKIGTGLGLFMSYSTIRGRFGGSMHFESEEGKGTTFYVSIPYIVQEGAL